MLLYIEAARFISTNPKNGSLQTHIFGAAKHKRMRSNPKHVFALVSSTLKYKPFIVEIIKNSRLLKPGKSQIPPDVAILLVHDLLFTKSGRLQSRQHPWKDLIVKNKARLHAEMMKLKLKLHVKSFDELVEDDETPIRWFRVNTIKTTKDAVLREFGQLERVYGIKDIKKGTIYHDEYIPNLFGVDPKEKITTTDAYKNGRIVIQDRSSCFPAFILNPHPGKDKIIDACAAPGNKTTHLAAIMENTPGSIIAFERDDHRVKTLEKMCRKAGALGCVKIQHGDFTETKPDNFPEVTAMLMDPSCSGSGIFGRAYERNLGTKEKTDKTANPYNKKRLEGLSTFQFTIVKHAMLFPNLRKLVYSTCSIYPEEDERVAIRLLEDPDLKKCGWQLCDREEVIPTWPRRGRKEEFKDYPDPEACAGACIRSLPKVDGGIGFFAVGFKRNVNNKAGEDDDKRVEPRSNSDSDSYNGEFEDQGEWKGFDD